MKERNKIIIAIVAIVLIIVVVLGATYAYWSWSSPNNKQTNVSFRIPSGNELLGGTFGGGTIQISKLVPVTSCTNTNYATKATITVTYFNETADVATVYGTLAISNFTASHGTPDPLDDLSHLHYAVTTSPSSCETGKIQGATGTLSTTTNGNLFTDVALVSNISPGVTNGTQLLYLYVWIDDSYVHTNVGSNTVDDPMEDLSFTLTWNASITNQPPVAGG